MEQLARDGIVKGFESQICRRDGGVAWISENAIVVEDPSGKPIRYEGSVEDITERKLAEQVLSDTNQRLEQALDELRSAQTQLIQEERLAAIGTMASGIAHDFNNALSPILGFSELLLLQPEINADPVRQKRMLELIHNSANDAAAVVMRLGEFYRYREDDDCFRAVEPNQLVEKVISNTQPRWKDQAMKDGKTVTIKADLKARVLVNASESELRELLTNLVFNAVDAVEAAGTILLRTYHSEEKVFIEVIDDGIGMTDEVRKRCLEPFFTTKSERGTGMGLAMVYGTVQRHGGSLEIESQSGKGSTFRLALPIDSGEAQHNEPELDEEGVSASLHILVVDDEPPILQFVTQCLKMDGHTFVTANNGLEALNAYEPNRFDLVITDRAMPKMNGDQLATAIKRAAPDQKIIMLTGFGEMMKSAMEKPAGVDAVVGKPVNCNQLTRAIKQILMVNVGSSV